MAEGLLGTIVSTKRDELHARFAGVSLDALRARASPTRRSLAAAIARPGARFILEVKKASPSAGIIRHGADAGAIARSYAGVADALSVLTEPAFFGGSLVDLVAARAAFDGPILAKDFFLDPRQVPEARIAGADAVLVMLSVLGDHDARAIIDEASRFGMDSLVEVHDEAEMRRAIALGAPLAGINNRDLRDLSIDLSTTERLAAIAGDRTLVSESGIASRVDVERLGGRVDGFLVGSSLMAADDPGDAARALLFGRVKLCGLNAAADFEAGRAAAYAGLIFVPESPRAVSVGDATRLAGLHPRPVGIFRDASVEKVADAAKLLGLAAVQLHGDEDEGYLRMLARKLPPGCETWKSVRVATRVPITSAVADRLLFDNGYGGTGRTFDWSLVKDHPALPRSLVAGGIGPGNASEAARLGAYALDVGSAADSRPGVKSNVRIAALFDALRPASRQALRKCA